MSFPATWHTSRHVGSTGGRNGVGPFREHLGLQNILRQEVLHDGGKAGVSRAQAHEAV
jgi:hypothetical protein